jgi:hypothetical protein
LPAAQARKTSQNDAKRAQKCSKCMLLMPKYTFFACFWVILVEPYFLNGKLLGFENPFSMNYWVWYLENRNHFVEHFRLSRNHLIEHFALFRLYEVEHFEAFPPPSSPQ